MPPAAYVCTWPPGKSPEHPKAVDIVMVEDLLQVRKSRRLYWSLAFAGDGDVPNYNRFERRRLAAGRLTRQLFRSLSGDQCNDGL